MFAQGYFANSDHMLINQILLLYQKNYIWVIGFEKLGSWWESSCFFICFYSKYDLISDLWQQLELCNEFKYDLCTLWIGVGSGLLILKQGSSTYSMSLLKRVTDIKIEDLLLRKEVLLRWLNFLFLLNWIFLCCVYY